jgi:hypothetical protein
MSVCVKMYAPSLKDSPRRLQVIIIKTITHTDNSKQNGHYKVQSNHANSRHSTQNEDACTQQTAKQNKQAQDIQ